MALHNQHVSSHKIQNKRFHELDALRAFAMLLGIVIHAIFWAFLNEPEAMNNEHLHWVSSFIHGFRMPLFMLLSGFFMAMLWRQRHLMAILKNRFLRVLLPLIVFTPILFYISILAWLPSPYFAMSKALSSNDEKQSFFNAENINSKGMMGFTAIQLATLLNDKDSVTWLLEQGANPNQSQAGLLFTPSGETALDIARFKGFTDIENVLLEAGGKAVSFNSDYKAPPLMQVDLSHLWFLWFLTLLIIGFVLIATILTHFPCKLPASWLVLSQVRYCWLVPLTLVFQSFMTKQWGPETFSSIFIPWYLLAYYAVFFSFGALYFQYRDNFGEDTRHWWIELTIATVALTSLGQFLMSSEALPKLANDTVTVLFAWMMIFGLIGLFRQCLARFNPVVRYLSDSAYFLYIFHMPFLLFLSNFGLGVSLAIELKIFISCLVSFTALLAIYHCFVRYTWLGRWLNGPRE